MNDILSRLKARIDSGHPFAIYAKPGSTQVTGVFQTGGETHYIDDYNAKGFIFAPFSQGNTIFIPYNQADIITETLDNVAIPEPKQPDITADTKVKQDFELLVSNCISTIKEGSFEKLVASRTEIAGGRVTNPITVFRRLLATYPNAFRYCFFSKETGLWMGATPEQLLKAEGNILHTVALAGTQLYKEGAEATWQQKEKQEQQYVTDYIKAELSAHCDNITATAPYTFRAGNLLHIKTDISAKISNNHNISNIIKALHPTPAVCGLPKAAAQAFLLQHEGYNREYYSGYLGELNHDFNTKQSNSDLYVNLRCMKVVDSTAHLYIGCGITADSNPQKEYEETVNKSMTMKRLF